MRTLELFAGTQSFSKGVIRAGWSPITVDLLAKFNPTHQANILDWNYRLYAPDSFDIIWCSPPCTDYSKAKTHGVRNLELADRLVAKCFEIIVYFNPDVWILENVGTGLLVKRMESIQPGLTPIFVDYCAYGKPYRKRTALWSNIPLSLRLCKGRGVCLQMNGTQHKASCGNGTIKYNGGITSVWEKDAIPDELIDDILQQLSPA